MLEKLKVPDFSIEDGWHAYLLLETEALEDYLRIQANSVERPSVLAAVKRVDFATLTGWIWADTDYAAHATRGPLLVQMESTSPLPGIFQTAWSDADVGVLFASQASMDDVLAHLRSILFVYLHDGAKARFRVQETAALSSVLRALTPPRVSQLLGPMNQLTWRENIVPAEHQWWRYQQNHDGNVANSPFQFTYEESAAIDRYLAERHLDEQVALTRNASHSYRDDPRQQTIDWMSLLRNWGFQKNEDIAAGLDLFRHEAFTTNAQAVTRILAQTDMTSGARITQASNYFYG